MTKKKMISIIMLVVFVLFIGASYLNFLGARSNVKSEMETKCIATASDVRESIKEYSERDEKDFEELHENFRNTLLFSSNRAEYDTYAYALTDMQGNILCKSESGVWFWHDKGTEYISLEEYITPEIKAELTDFIKTADGDILLPHELNLNYNGEVFTPVSVVFTDNIFPGDPEDGDEFITFSFNDLEVTHVFNGGDGLVCELYNLYGDAGYGELNTELDEKIKDLSFLLNGTAGYSSSGFDYNNDRFQVIEASGDYIFIGFARYNPNLKALTSLFFYNQTIITVCVFLILTVVTLIVAVKLFNKNERIKKNQQAFTSAAAHELKTPLAVIQNQCECIMEGIAPEKNEKYVQSIYDEAVRMNGIVKTLLLFNRVSNADKVIKSECDFSEIAAAELEKYEAYAQSNNVKLNADIQDAVAVNANAELLALAVDNYLSNAIKYAAGEKSVSVSLKKDGLDFVFSVYNDCDGIDNSDDVWEVLTKGDKARSSDRNSGGMGLPICKRIFELHSFRYYYKNEKDGVTFVFKGKTNG
ncbi:MAG: HAMP domain-containing histidine kinase [Clostridia bacterium]|nr:HAMP domain-containing histidine kinase [Clostridia bacterium]